MSRQDFLIEIGTEELPPKSLKKLSEALAAGLLSGVEKAELGFASIESFASPRRLAVYIHDLEEKQQNKSVERKGPALAAAFDAQGAATPACLGFAKSCGVDVAQLQQVETDKGAWLTFKQEQKGQTVHELMPAIVQQAIKKLPIPKVMRWGSHDVQFVRPVHWLVMLFGEQVIDAELLGQRAGNTTYGHRFHHPDAITIKSPEDYKRELAAVGHVIASFEERRESIRAEVLELASSKNGVAVIDEDLLNEVTGLVEWPVPLLGSFDESFLVVPAEALITAMKNHQKCFHLIDASGMLLPCFITISNIESLNKEEVIRGNERVMRARLADSAFFFEKDQKQNLETQLERLRSVIFQKDLGSVYEKVERLQQLSKVIAGDFDVDQAVAMRAATLAKCDLMTDMVGEFPELQGIMGYYYAKHDGEDEKIAIAIKEHYQPRFAADELPGSALGNVVALAERLDTLVGIFGINQQPTGEKDPFALRRAANGVVRILVESKTNTDLLELIEVTKQSYKVTLPNKDVIKEVHHFIIERMRSWYQEQGVAADVFAAVLARQSTQLFDFKQRVDAVTQFRQLAEAQALAAANKRVSNILQKEALFDPVNGFSQDLLVDINEKTLAELLIEKQAQVMPLYESANYDAALNELASLKQPIDNFFDHVMVMVDDEKLRNNRLALLAKLRQLFSQVADISLLQG